MEIQILNMISTLRNPLLNSIMVAITSLANLGLVWIALCLILLVYKKTRRVGLYLAVALILDLVFCNIVIKPVFARARPFTVNKQAKILIKEPKDYSFPSGHTAASFASTTSLFLGGMTKSGIAALVLSCLIAFSRLYIYVHYPTDVLGGMIIGILCGIFGRIIVEKWLFKLPVIKRFLGETYE